MSLGDLQSYDSEDVVTLAAGYLRLREAAQALVDALPKCKTCGSKPATREYVIGERYCDDCSAVREIPHGAAIRNLVTILDGSR